jgi:hypothetical protein
MRQVLVYRRVYRSSLQKPATPIDCAAQSNLPVAGRAAMIRLFTALIATAFFAAVHAADTPGAMSAASSAVTKTDQKIRGGAEKAAAVVVPPVERAQDKAADATYNAGESVGKGLKKGGEAVGRGAEKAGAAIKRGATKTKDAVKRGAKKAKAAVTPASAAN